MNAQITAKSRRPRLAIAAAASLALLALSTGGAEAHNDGISNTGAAIVGGLAGVVIGAAIADSAAHSHANAYNGYRAAPYPPPYRYPAAAPYRYGYGYPNRVYAARPFAPDAGVVCYPDRQICYDDNGTVAKRWTRRLFGY